MILDNLNAEQQSAVQHLDGPMLILAGAGSGKTRVITHRVAYLIQQGIDPNQILAITFTNKAAGELRERVDSMVGYGASRVWVSTFHSLCVRILRKHIDRLNYDPNFTIYDTEDQKRVIKEAMRYLKIDPKMYPERQVMAHISKAKELFLTPRQFDVEAQGDFRKMQIANIYTEYQKRLHDYNGVDFDDLLFLTVELFQDFPDVLEEYQQRFRYIMVDEYQDTNEIQFLLVRQLARKWRNLCVVGDDDQSIYKFRGANIMNILNFEDEYKEAMVVKLEENYRSTGNILAAANAVIANNTERKDKALRTEREDGAKVFYKQYEDENQEANEIASMIQEYRAKNDLNYNDFAVLYRTNAQSRVLEEKMIFRNIPYRIYGGQNFYGRMEIKDILAYLRVLSNDADDISVKRIINVPKRGIGATTIAKLEEYAQREGFAFIDAVFESDLALGVSAASKKVSGFADLIDDLTEAMESMSLSELYDHILDVTGYREELVAEHTEESMSRLENLAELKNKIVAYEEETEDPNLDDFLAEVSLVADVDNLNSTDDHVILMTMHSAKGLEFPYVFLAGMEEGLFPSGMAMKSGDESDIEEERRLCYVGITRAQERLFLTGAKQRKMWGSTNRNPISRFIKEIPPELMDMGGYKKLLAEPETEMQPKISPVFTKKPDFGKSFHVEKLTSLDYGVGDRVEHVKFGVGTVTEVIRGKKDFEVTVDFDEYGTKRLFASFAKLKKV